MEEDRATLRIVAAVLGGMFITCFTLAAIAIQ